MTSPADTPPEPTQQDRDEAMRWLTDWHDGGAMPSDRSTIALVAAITRARHAGEVAERERGDALAAAAERLRLAMLDIPTEGYDPRAADRIHDACLIIVRVAREWKRKGAVAAAIRSLAPDTEGKK